MIGSAAPRYEPPYTEQVQRALVVELFEKTTSG